MSKRQEDDVVGKEEPWLIGAEIMFLFVESERTHTQTHPATIISTQATDNPMLASTGIVLRESSAKNEGSVIIYSPPCCSKPV